MKIYSQNGKKNLIGNRVRIARMRGRNLVSQQELAARLSVMGISMDRTTISKIEAGDRLVTDYELYAISRALGLSIEWFFSDTKLDY
jgi:transcriptional regulator with XRE-family HTH domain